MDATDAAPNAKSPELSVTLAPETYWAAYITVSINTTKAVEFFRALFTLCASVSDSSYWRLAAAWEKTQLMAATMMLPIPKAQGPAHCMNQTVSLELHTEETVEVLVPKVAKKVALSQCSV